MSLPPPLNGYLLKLQPVRFVVYVRGVKARLHKRPEVVPLVSV